MQPRIFFLSRSLLTLVLLVGLGASLVMAMPRAQADDGTELVVNGDFSDGTAGWRTNGSDASMTVLDGHVAQLSTNGTGNATLNDRVNTVATTSEGASYVATARVRTTTPIVNGALRIREVGATGVRSHQSSFNLRDTQWQVVTLRITTTYTGAHLDLNLTAWQLPAGQNLQVDWISLKEVPSTAPIAPPPPSTGGETSTEDTLFGSSVSTVGKTLDDSLRQVDGDFGPVPVIRHFSPGLPFRWDSSTADSLSGRTLVLSFKAHPTEITSGRLDSFFRSWFESAPTDQTIYWSYFHEPENNINAGEFTESQYRAAWARLGRLADEVRKPNLLSTLILTSWTMDPRSGRDYRSYDAGPEAVDVIAFDPYNGIWDPQRDYYQPPQEMLGAIVRTMESDGRPWGIAEIGSRIVRGDDGAGRAAWLRDIGEYAAQNDALFVTYFHSIGNADWRLQDRASRDAWADLVSG